MDKLKGAKYFSKMDIQWGYNNIQIRQGDEWKAVFKTNKGLFKLMVMFFWNVQFTSNIPVNDEHDIQRYY